MGSGSSARQSAEVALAKASQSEVEDVLKGLKPETYAKIQAAVRDEDEEAQRKKCDNGRVEDVLNDSYLIRCGATYMNGQYTRSFGWSSTGGRRAANGVEEMSEVFVHAGRDAELVRWASGSWSIGTCFTGSQSDYCWDPFWTSHVNTETPPRKGWKRMRKDAVGALWIDDFLVLEEEQPPEEQTISLTPRAQLRAKHDLTEVLDMGMGDLSKLWKSCELSTKGMMNRDAFLAQAREIFAERSAEDIH
eukprot:TRINITY_DN66117_c0_g1_i1.p1 TRINITY_DN66117_c0_g1~~TRINITY_DN66117_c0_g1_i1.p1  ORF type:complete len:248 (-),score=45.60 TRINITY_DN66117_c0_g1_i1:181-924(-)